MSVERHADWGERAKPPPDLAIFDSDAAARDFVVGIRRTGAGIPPIGLTGGDLLRTLGGSTGPDLRDSEDALRVDVDLGAVLIDGALSWFISHLIARNGWWRGPITIAANAAFVGHWNVAPRAHPGDHKLDTLDVAQMSIQQRWQARQRLGTGTHLPHPSIVVARTAAVQWSFERARTIYLDGQPVGDASSVSVRIEPDALEVWV